LTLFDAIILGLLQGFTEFLPVSSSGHLAIAQSVLKLSQPPLFLDSMLHFGTLLAVILYFRADIIDIIKSVLGIKIDGKDSNIYRKLAIYLIIGSIPAAIVGISLESLVEKSFASLPFVAVMLIVTGVILWISDSINSENHSYRDISMLDSIWVGLAQAIAILPGLSRSGSTITASLWRGMDRDAAARFSFLLSIPVILGASALSLYKALGDGSINFSLVFTGSLIAFLSGLIAIRMLIYLLKRERFIIFSAYCFVVGTLILIIYYF